MGWNLNELTASADAPLAASNPTGYVVPAQGTQHVVYRGSDNHVHELWWGRTGWHRQDLTRAASAPFASGDPTSCVAIARRTQHVVHGGGDGHLHELWRDERGWHHDDLTALCGGAPAIAGSPSVCAFERKDSRHVVYRDAAGHIHQLGRQATGWSHVDVTAATSAPLALGNPALYTDEARGTLHVAYRGGDNRVHALVGDEAGWRRVDLGAAGAGAPTAIGDLCGYIFPGQGTEHIVFRAGDGRLHELWRDERGFHHENLSAEAGGPAAADDPVAYVFQLQGTQHVLYRATDNLIHELWWDVNGWHHDAMGALSPPAAGRPAGYSFETQKTQHAIYRQTDGRVDELWWQLEGAGTGGAGRPPQGGAITLTWDPIVFGGEVPVGGTAVLTVSQGGAFRFRGNFHGSGFAAFNVLTVWALRTRRGAVFTFGTAGAVHGTLGTGSRDFNWELSGTHPGLAAAWGELEAGWNWQAQSATSLDWAKVWGDVRGALGEVHSVSAVVGPVFD